MERSEPEELIERCTVFGESAIRLARTSPRSPTNDPLVSQPIRSATSIGANYCEARNASSRKDFFHRVAIAQREAHESRHWLRMLVAAVDSSREEARKLWKEANELHLILSKTVSHRRATPT